MSDRGEPRQPGSDPRCVTWPPNALPDQIDEFRRVGDLAIDAIATITRASTARAGPAADVTPADVAARFARRAARGEGEPAEALLADWRARVAPLLTAIGSPRHFAFVNGSGAMIGVFAEALAAAVNTNAGAWKLGPAATEIERQCLRWIAGFIGYPEDTGGILVSGGTMANFTAILTALCATSRRTTRRPHGLQDRAGSGRFLLYMSDHEGHVSVTRVADMLNLGRERGAPRAEPARTSPSIPPRSTACSPTTAAAAICPSASSRSSDR